MSSSAHAQKFDLKSMKLSSVDLEWYKNSHSENISNINSLGEITNRIAREDLGGF